MPRMIPAGTKLGAYEILALIAEGGMGAVYQARDLRLNRTVAIKVLLPDISNFRDARARFEREAQTIAALNHPHICVLYDVGRHDSTDFLVMEFLEGRTLAQRLENGPIELVQALKYAGEIADALDKAHRHDVTHRDLKPGNIMLTKNGVKLMDFGLAKLRESQPVSSVSQAPTRASLTAEGTILGSLQYMAPEQLEGIETDARTDIFAFGAVLYEMITAQRPFQGKSQASLIGAILKDTPPLVSSVTAVAPPALDRLISRCLAKDPDDRWQTSRDIWHELKWIAEQQPKSEVRMPRRRPAVPVFGALAAVLLAIVGTFIAVRLMVQTPPTSLVARVTMPLPAGMETHWGGFALSDDSSQVAYVGRNRSDGSVQLYVRALNSLEARPLASTLGARDPFFSPDGQWIGFSDGKFLKKVSVSGGAVTPLADALNGNGFATWTSDNTIFFSIGLSGAIWKVSASGGEPQAVTTLDRSKNDESHVEPHILPGNKAVVFTVLTGWGWDRQRIDVQSLMTGERRTLVEGANKARYLAPGYLVYHRNSNQELVAAPFDLDRLELTGPPVPLGIYVQSQGLWRANFDVSRTGTLIYLPGNPRGIERRLIWMDRKGTVEPVQAQARGYQDVRISPDGRYAITQAFGGTTGIWLYDLARSTHSPLSTDETSIFPIWTPDSKSVTYSGFRKGAWAILQRATDGSGAEQELFAIPEGSFALPGAWTRDGKHLLLQMVDDKGRSDLWSLSLEERKLRALTSAPSWECCFALSPNGRWLAYSSDTSGQTELWVQGFPDLTNRKQISKDGGMDPRWSPDGRELFYIRGTEFMSVDIGSESNFSPKAPRVLFEYGFNQGNEREYDVSPDGKRFLTLQRTDAERPATQIQVVLNWVEELKQRMR